MSLETELQRCSWSRTTSDFYDYHDSEWGVPTDNDSAIFERICLESFQSGLSWRTILNKRDNFRHAFSHFDMHAVAQFEEHDVQRLLHDAGIVRHKGKIEATINNAQRACEQIEVSRSLAAYFWPFRPAALDLANIALLSETELAQPLAKDLKKKGWKFVGPTTVYAFMQSMGLVNDHETTCHAYSRVEKAIHAFSARY